ncbi:uncharacterized protein LOC144558590 isoform X2 [Carex rostrata]
METKFVVPVNEFSEFSKTAEEIGHKFPRFIGVLNTMPDEHIDGYYPRKRIRLALGGKESPGEGTFLRSAGSDADELTDTSASIDFHSKGMESMNGPSNDASCYFLKATGLGSPKHINVCIEEQDYIGSINLVQDYLDKINNIVKSGGSQDVLKAALSAMEQVTDMLTSMSLSSSLAHSRL